MASPAIAGRRRGRGRAAGLVTRRRHDVGHAGAACGGCCRGVRQEDLRVRRHVPEGAAATAPFVVCAPPAAADTGASNWLEGVAPDLLPRREEPSRGALCTTPRPEGASLRRRRAAASCPGAGLKRGGRRAHAGGRRCGGPAVGRGLGAASTTEVRVRRRRFVAMGAFRCGLFL